MMRIANHLKLASVALAWLAVLGFAAPAAAGQHLIQPGEDWASRAARIKPGDEIILMPGRHRNASFEQLIGTKDHPITIRGVSRGTPAIIVARSEGLRIRSGAFVQIRDLQITAATISGVVIGEVGSDTRDIVIRNVQITRTGPRGLRHAITATHASGLRISESRFEGWGGAAIELIGCEDVTIERCHFEGLDDHDQKLGVRARAGSDRVTIEHCRFQRAGDIAISLGKRSEPREFRTASDAAVAPNTPVRAEARRVQVERCVIVGGQCAIAFINADDCTVRSNTLSGQRPHIMALLAEQADPAFSPGRRNVFGANLVTWKAGELERIALVGDDMPADAITLEGNLWWPEHGPAEAPVDWQKLGGFPGPEGLPQTIDVNPLLDEQLKPRNPEAAAYGAG